MINKKQQDQRRKQRSWYQNDPTIELRSLGRKQVRECQ